MMRSANSPPKQKGRSECIGPLSLLRKVDALRGSGAYRFQYSLILVVAGASDVRVG